MRERDDDDAGNLGSSRVRAVRGIRVHSGLRWSAAKLPTLQLIGATEPATQKAPGGHGPHESALARLVLLAKLPAVHGSGAAAPSGQ